MDENSLRQKLRKIENLFAGAVNEGEYNAARAAILRIKEQLNKKSEAVQLVECKFCLDNKWSRQLFLALCRRYGLKPYRYYRQRATTVMIKASESFIDKVLYPEFVALDNELHKYFDNQITNVIKEEVHSNINDAEEVSNEPSSLRLS